MDIVVAKACCLRLNFFHLDKDSKNNNNKVKNALENIGGREGKKRKCFFMSFFLNKESNYIQATRLTTNAKVVLDAVLTG